MRVLGVAVVGMVVLVVGVRVLCVVMVGMMVLVVGERVLEVVFGKIHFRFLKQKNTDWGPFLMKRAPYTLGLS